MAKANNAEVAERKVVTLADLVELKGPAAKKFEQMKKAAAQFLALIADSEDIPIRHLRVLRNDLNRPFILMLRERMPSKAERIAERIESLQKRLAELNDA